MQIKTNNVDKKKIDISIIVPVYNVDQYLEQCNQSLIRQKTENFQIEIIYVNDGSTDSSEEYLKNILLFEKNIPITIISKKNQGVSIARNQGLELAKGEYVIFVDGDDYVADTYCSEMYNLMTDTDADIGMCNYYLIKDNGKYSNSIPSSLFKKKIFDNKNEIYKYIIGRNGFKGFVWNKIYKKNKFSDISFDDKFHYLEDLIFNLHCINKTEKIAYSTNSLYFYRIRDDSAVNTFNEKQLTYLEAIDYSTTLVSESNVGYLQNNKLLALIEFGMSSRQVNKKDLYHKLKQQFEKSSKKHISKLRIDLKTIIIIANINFYLGGKILLWEKRLMNTKLYTKLKK